MNKEKRTILDKLRNYQSQQVVCYVTILGEKIPLSKNDILHVLGCKEE